MTKRHPRDRGFTLAELAIVLIIVGLLSGGLLGSLSAQLESQKLREVRKELAEIREDLLGFAATNGYLPCPDKDTDPALPGYGVADPPPCSGEGWLPFKSLGSAESDPWGNHRSRIDDPSLGRWRYRVDRQFVAPLGLDTLPQESLSVIDRNGIALTNTAEARDRPVAIIYSLGPDGTANGPNADANTDQYMADGQTEGFDDQLIWISRPLLFNRLIAAGRPL